MMRLLQYLQSKPRAVRSQYSALIAGIATGAIAVVWVSTIPSRFAEVEAPRTEPEEGLSDFGALIEDTKAQLGNVVGADSASGADIGTNLDLLGTGDEPGEGSGDAIGAFLVPSGESGSATGTPAGEKRVLIETVKTTPKPILLGTTTNSE